MAEMKKKFGKMPCETCGELVTVKINDRETLSYHCQECDATPYAKKGTGQHTAWLKKTAVPDLDEEKSIEPDKMSAPGKPTPQPKPAPKSAGLLI